MNIVSGFWHKICEPLDGFLWHKDISHPIIRPMLRNQILATGFCILAGAMCYAIVPWLFWLGAGLLSMTWIFWSWARFFLRRDWREYSAAFLWGVILRFVLRLIILALLLFIALRYCSAPVAPILAGMICGVFLGLGSYGLHIFFPNRP